MPDHWIEKLFLEKGHLYRKVLDDLLPRAAAEAEGVKEFLLANGVGKGSRVLDLACGAGRHTVELARLGFRVTGFDLTPDYVERARALARERGVEGNTDIRAGDMREVGRILAGERFDAVVNLFTSFGFYDDETNVRILEQCRTIVREGGIFLIDSRSRDWLVRNFQPRGFTRVGDLLVLEERKLHLESGRVRSRWTFLSDPGTGDCRSEGAIDLDLRIYTLHELIGDFARAGWSFLRAHSDFQGNDLDIGSPRIVALFANERGAG